MTTCHSASGINTSDDAVLAANCIAIEVEMSHQQTGQKNKGFVTADVEKLFQTIQRANNKCFWNSSLLTGISRLQYVGCIKPSVIVVNGESEHIEAVKAAWSRRLLRTPDGLRIIRLGDIGSIQMQSVSQTKFMPLPDTLCMIVSDLTSNHEAATLDSVQHQLKAVYTEMCLPPAQIVYETLRQLVNERKIMHTANGYFIVPPYKHGGNPSTYSDQQFMFSGQPFCMSPGQHHPVVLHDHQMFGMAPVFIPVTPTKILVTSKSCQTSREKSKTSREKENKVPQRKLERSQSFEKSYSMRISKNAELEGQANSFRRSASMRFNDERAKAVMKDVNSQHSNIHQDKDKGEKSGLLSKLFGKSKKMKSPSVSSKESKEEDRTDEVQHAIFSAQFPPPEWEWYKHERITNCAIPKSSTWHHFSPVGRYSNNCHTCNIPKHLTLPSYKQNTVEPECNKAPKDVRRKRSATVTTDIKTNVFSNKCSSAETSEGALDNACMKNRKQKRKPRLSRSISAPSGKLTETFLGPREQEMLLQMTVNEEFTELEKSDIYNPYSSRNYTCATTENGAHLTFVGNNNNNSCANDGSGILLDCVDDLHSVDEETYEDLSKASENEDQTNMTNGKEGRHSQCTSVKSNLVEHRKNNFDKDVHKTGSRTHHSKNQHKLSSNSRKSKDEVFNNDPYYKHLPNKTATRAKSRDSGVNCIVVAHAGSKSISKSNAKAHQKLNVNNESDDTRVIASIKNLVDPEVTLGDSGFSSPLSDHINKDTQNLPNNSSLKHNINSADSQLSLDSNHLLSSEYYPSMQHLKLIKETDLDEDLYLGHTGPKGDFGSEFEVVALM